MQEKIKYRISYLFRSNFVLKILKGGTVCKTDFLNLIRYSLCYNLHHLLLHNFCPFFRKKGPVVFFQQCVVIIKHFIKHRLYTRIDILYYVHLRCLNMQHIVDNYKILNPQVDLITIYILLCYKLGNILHLYHIYIFFLKCIV